MEELYEFHNANIHELRIMAFLCRCLPLAIFATIISLNLVSFFLFPTFFLLLNAFLNVLLWLHIVYNAVWCFIGVFKVAHELRESANLQLRENAVVKNVAGASYSSEALDAQSRRGSSMAQPLADESFSNPQEGQQGFDNIELVHMIVIPNYKEDEEMMAETLQSLAEARSSHAFRVVLAMEAREEQAVVKGERLAHRFKDSFASIVTTFHPRDLVQDHLDGSQDAEIPGKASNLRWAVPKGFEEISKEKDLNPQDVLVTIADSDCIFHPGYFDKVSSEVLQSRLQHGCTHVWTMWQAPQLPFRNYWQAPICSTMWGVISSVFEFGGTSSLAAGDHHMPFSAYTLNLRLALDALPWDGDVIAEDHHCFLKSWFHSVHASATDMLVGRHLQNVCRPKLKVSPVFLPVKSLSVVSNGYWDTWKQRWHQARRHTQGIAEMSYAALATFDALASLPRRFWNVALFAGLFKVNLHMFLLHMLPSIQAITLGELTLFWLWYGQKLPMCPDIKWMEADHEFLICGLAGAYSLVWPVVVPVALVFLANFLFLSIVFLRQRTYRFSTFWHKEDSGIPSSAQYFRLAFSLALDCISLSPLMFVYGFAPFCLSITNLIFNGNRFKYITAAKGAPRQSEGQSELELEHA